MILQEKFNDNENKWSEREDDTVLMAIQDSGYVLEHKKKGGHWRSGIHVEVPAGSPYRIYTTLEKISGVNNNGYGLMWRHAVDEAAETYEAGDFWTFEVSGDGHYRMCQWKEDESKWYNHVSWTRSDHVLLENNRNELLVVQGLDTVTFYLNGIEIETVAMPPVDDSITKQVVGFIVTNQIKIKAHHITIDEHDATVPLANYRSGEIVND